MSWRIPLMLVFFCIAAGCSCLNPELPRVPSFAFDRPEETTLGIHYAAHLAASPGLAGFRTLVSGEEAFIVRAATAEAAQKSLDLQYFIVSNDATATLLLYRALQAAERDVRVRILVDDVGSSDNYNLLSTLDAHPGIEVRSYNPFFSQGFWGGFRVLEYLGDSSRLNRRMHNKLWIADNAVAVIGGRNLGDAYFAVNRSNNFADLDILMTGPLVRDVSRSFDAYWNNATAIPIKTVLSGPAEPDQLAAIKEQLKSRAEKFRDTHYANALRETDFRHLLRNGQLALVTAPAVVLNDLPEKNFLLQEKHQPIVAALRSTIRGAQREAVLISPYFIPGEHGVAGLCSLAKKGVRVRILTNSLASTDIPLVHAGYARYRPRLLACGVELHELRPGVKLARKRLSLGTTLHAKVVIVDRSTLIVGSMNLDPRSRMLNTEVAVRIESPVLAEELAAHFDEAVAIDQSYRVELVESGNVLSDLVWVGEENSSLVRLDSEPKASVWRHLVSGLFGSMFPEELM